MPRIRLSPAGAGGLKCDRFAVSGGKVVYHGGANLHGVAGRCETAATHGNRVARRNKTFGYISEIETGLGFRAATVNGTGLLLTPNPSAVTEIWYVEGGIGTPQKLLAPSLFWRQSLTLM